MSFRKVVLTNGNGTILGTAIDDTWNLQKVASLVPDYETLNAKRLLVSPVFDTFAEALNYEPIYKVKIDV